jgi:hypothetical protein
MAHAWHRLQARLSCPEGLVAADGYTFHTSRLGKVVRYRVMLAREREVSVCGEVLATKGHASGIHTHRQAYLPPKKIYTCPQKRVRGSEWVFTCVQRLSQKATLPSSHLKRHWYSGMAARDARVSRRRAASLLSMLDPSAFTNAPVQNVLFTYRIFLPVSGWVRTT